MRTNPALPYNAGAAIAGRRIVKFGASDGVVVQGAAATDKLIGVSDSVGATASGDRVMVYQSGDDVEIDVGGTITRGDEVTSDANGKAVSAAAITAGTTVRIIGTANGSFVSGDVGGFRLLPCSKTMPA